eukprot:TRINITY_DN1261_c0_g1_i2.p2 TRINITY_DN1261_c0_g1~~TRINITY_DN1261_c0_g1_i2.p2  ORF type:complete len:186 (+),score=33.86 TRINITY_DN1261_c0_g1_i2:252-809(+)
MARQLLPRPALARAAPALAAFVGLMALLWFQLIPAAGGPVSVDTHHTRLHLLTTAVYGAAFLLVLLLATHGRRLRLLALALVFSGVFQALLAIFLHAARAKVTLGYFEVDHALRAFGSNKKQRRLSEGCLLYTSDAADDMQCVDLGGRRIIKKKKKIKKDAKVEEATMKNQKAASQKTTKVRSIT